MKRAHEDFANLNEFELVREEEKRHFESQLNPLNLKLASNSEIFIRNLYFGVLIHIIQNYEQYDVIIPKDFLPFVEKSNNLKILSELIEKFFAKEVYADEKKFKALNEFILGQNEGNNKQIYKKLTEYDYFNLTLNHLVETLTNDFDYRMIIYEVSLEFLFILHNLYCKSIKTLDLDTFLLREKDEDPLYIIFKYLNFEEIPINDYNSDTLRMNINLRTDPKLLMYSQINSVLQKNEKFQFYRCLNCNILLPKNLLAKKHSSSISDLEKNGWECLCKKFNKINDFQCLATKCHRVIPIKDFNFLSIINKFYQEADPLQYLFLDVMTHMDIIKNGKNLMNEIQDNLERAKKKEDHFLVGKITDFFRKLDEKLEENGGDAKALLKKKEKICEKLRENGLLVSF